MPPCREARMSGSAMFTAVTSMVMTLKPSRDASRAAGDPERREATEGPASVRTGPGAGVSVTDIVLLRWGPLRGETEM